VNGERDHLLRLRTPEGVGFSFRLASPVLRAAALVVDLAVVAATWSAVATVVGLLAIVSRDFAVGVSIVGYFVLSQGYRIFAEWRWSGQTLGKRLLHLRVIDERGLPVTFAQIALRNLLRFIDSLPAAYAVGGVAALVNARAQRLGDLAAGTVVVWEPEERVPDLALLRGEKYNTLRVHAAVVARLRQTLTPIEARAAWQALARRDRLEPAARLELFAELAAGFRQRASVPAELTDGITDEQFVRNVVDVLYLSR
jgi:uncharacterized RDD family membrane protein YckC